MVDCWVTQGKQDGVQGQTLHRKIIKFLNISDLRLVTCILILSSPSSAVDSGIRPAIAFKPSPWFFTAPESLESNCIIIVKCLQGCDGENWEVVQSTSEQDWEIWGEWE